MPKYPEATVGRFSSWLGERPTNRIGVHFVARTRSRRLASWRCSLLDAKLFRSFSSRRIFRNGQQRRATTLRRSLTISGTWCPIVPTSKDSNDCGFTSRRRSRKCRRPRPGGLPKRSVHQPCSTKSATSMPARAPTTSPDHGRLRPRVVMTEPPTEDFGPTRVASIDTGWAWAIANATSTHPNHDGDPVTLREPDFLDIRTRKVTSDERDFGGSHLRPSDLGLWWR